MVTVHQPSSRMFHSFSKLLLLSRGQVAYYGPTANIGRFFCTIGLTLLPHYNPADFIRKYTRRFSKLYLKIIKYLPLEKERKRKDSAWSPPSSPTRFALFLKQNSSHNVIFMVKFLPLNFYHPEFTSFYLIFIIQMLPYGIIRKSYEIGDILCHRYPK